MLKILEINNTCISCDNCRIICPEAAIISDGKEFAIDQWTCTLCYLCVTACPSNSIKESSKNQ